MSFDGGIFDVDGVLVDSPHEQAWRQALEQLLRQFFESARALEQGLEPRHGVGRPFGHAAQPPEHHDRAVDVRGLLLEQPRQGIEAARPLRTRDDLGQASERTREIVVIVSRSMTRQTPKASLIVLVAAAAAVRARNGSGECQ